MGRQEEVTLVPGGIFPDVEFNLITANTVQRVLFPGRSGGKWTAVLIYCGGACPECCQKLVNFQEMIREGGRDNVRVMAVSGDDLRQAVETMWRLKVSFPVAYGVDAAQLKSRMTALCGKGTGILHPAIILVDPQGRVANVFDGRHEGVMCTPAGLWRAMSTSAAFPHGSGAA